MDAHLLISWNGELLALTPGELARAREKAKEIMPKEATASAGTGAADGPVLLTAEQMAERTGVPESWWMKAARERDVAHVLVGKYVRFPKSVLESFKVIEPVRTTRRADRLRAINGREART